MGNNLIVNPPDDLISRSAFMSLLKEQYQHNIRFRQNATAKGWQGAMQLLYDAPSVDAVPVVHGKWMKIPNEKWFTCGENPQSGCAVSCSVCGDICPCKLGTPHFPICGAKMDGRTV